MFQCHGVKVKKAKVFYNGHHYTYVAVTDTYGKIEANRFNFSGVWILSYQEKFPHGGHIVNYATVDSIGDKIMGSMESNGVIFLDPKKDDTIPLNQL